MIGKESDESSGVRVPLFLRFVLCLIKHTFSFLCRSDGALNRRLADFIALKVPARRVPDRRGVASCDVVVDSETGVSVRLFYPTVPVSVSHTGASEGGLPVIFYFHGGGFALFHPSSMLYDRFCRRLARYCDALVISVDYRCSPEYCYPTAYEDCMLALRWLRDGGTDEVFLPLKADLSRCFLSGDSAGGNITHHIGCEVAANPLHMAPLHIQGHILLFPFFGSEERTGSEVRLRHGPLISMKLLDWFWKAFLPKGATRDHPASNVFCPDAPDISHLELPSSLITVGEFDPLKDWQFHYKEELQKAGKQVQLIHYEGGVHDFHLFSEYKLSTRLLLDVQQFLSSLSQQRL